MLDVLELEKRWSKYHFRKVLPLYIITVSIIATLVAVPGYVYINNPELIAKYLPKKETPVQKRKAPKEVVQEATIKSDNQQVVSSTQVIIEQNTLIPSFVFLRTLDDQLISESNRLKLAAIAAAKHVVKKAPKKSKAKKVKRKKAVVKPKPKKVEKKVAVPIVKPVEATPVPTQTKVTVLGDNSKYKQKNDTQQKPVQVGHKNTSKTQLNSVIKRFNKSKKPALGLFIANKYYEQGNYKESYNYARQTYNINPNIEGAVILYAKSLTKLGQKDKAISKLKLYIKKSGSIKAKALLSQIKKGTL